MAFDTKGLFFTITFFGCFTLLFFATKISSDIIFSSFFPEEQGIEKIKNSISLRKTERFEKRWHALASVINAAEIAKKRIVIGFVGDIMLDRGVKEATWNYGNKDFRFPFQNIAETLRGYDILFGNLEGPLSDKGNDAGSLYSFRMDPDAIQGLHFAGFDIVSLANNHIGDWGEEAILDTQARLAGAHIAYAGGGYKPKVLTVGDSAISFLAFSESGVYGIGERYVEDVEQSIKKAKETSDVVIVSFHFGEEYQTEPNRYQQKISRRAIEAGADAIVGHHPHVVQPIEWYKNSFIAYSLGNFVFDQNFSEATMAGLLLEVVIEDKKITEVRPRDVVINKRFQPSFRSDFEK